MIEKSPGFNPEYESEKNQTEESLESVGFSERTYNCLSRAGFKNLSDLTHTSDLDLLNIRNIGENQIAEVRQKLAEKGLYLMDEGPEKK